jgi:hypothetical protein
MRRLGSRRTPIGTQHHSANGHHGQNSDCTDNHENATLAAAVTLRSPPRGNRTLPQPGNRLRFRLSAHRGAKLRSSGRLQHAPYALGRYASPLWTERDQRRAELPDVGVPSIALLF